MLIYSVILPVYNVQAYLPECLDSILTQDSDSEYEVILVDDGSRDESGRICDEYAAKHSNIRVIHQVNQGVSSARNVGLAAAAGEYVLFCDPDDFYAPDALAMLDSQLEMSPDMVVFCAKSFEENGNEKDMRPALLPNGESGKGYMQRLFQTEQFFPVAVWHYLYRRAFLTKRGLSFQKELTVAEDFDFNFRALDKAETVRGLDSMLYFYRIHNASISRIPSVKNVYTKSQIYAKYFRKYPTAPLANIYCYHVLDCADCAATEELQALLGHYRANRDIWKHVTWRKLKLARIVLGILGYYKGSKLIAFGIHAKNRILGR